MASIPACHAGDRGSIPRVGVFLMHPGEILMHGRRGREFLCIGGTFRKGGGVREYQQYAQFPRPTEMATAINGTIG